MNRCPFGLQKAVFVLEQKVKNPKAALKLKCNFSRPQTTKNKGASLSIVSKLLNLFNP